MPSFSRGDFNEGHLQRGFFVLAYLAIVVVIAYWIGTEQISFLYLGFLVGSFILLTILLQREIWILILLGWSSTGATGMLSLPLSMRDMSVLLAVGAYVCTHSLSGSQKRHPWHPLDGILAVNMAYLALTFCINPVGFRVFGAETIGARPYFSTLIAVLGYWVIWRLPSSLKAVSRIPLFILCGSIIAVSLYALADFFPSLPSRIPYLYMMFNVGAYFSNLAMGDEIVRYKELGFFGGTLLLTLCSYYPFLALLNPLRLHFYTLLLGIICVLISGFRSALGSACVMFGVTSWFHGGFRKFFLATVVGGVLLVGIILGQGSLYSLPLSVQRSLSFLPGRWAPEVVFDAEESSRGRFDWWREVIKYNMIKNWWFGDGFGARETDVALASRGGAREMAFVTGSLHSGPLTAIRYVGIFGLLLFYALMIMSAVNAYRCVQKCSGTIFQPVAIYLAAQLIWQPIGYTLIFGAYNEDLPQQIFLAGLTRLLMRTAEELPPPSPATDAVQHAVKPVNQRQRPRLAKL